MSYLVPTEDTIAPASADPCRGAGPRAYSSGAGSPSSSSASRSISAQSAERSSESPSHPGTVARPDMAYSVEDDTYIALYAVWQDPALDAGCVSWATQTMRDLAPVASGIQLADENLGRRPARFVSDEHLARLDAIRAQRDPDGRFHPWMGRV